MTTERLTLQRELERHYINLGRISGELMDGSMIAFRELRQLLIPSEDDMGFEMDLDRFAPILPYKVAGTLFSTKKIMEDVIESYGAGSMGFPSNSLRTYEKITQLVGYLLRDGVVRRNINEDSSMHRLGVIYKLMNQLKNEKSEAARTQDGKDWVKL